MARTSIGVNGERYRLWVIIERDDGLPARTAETLARARANPRLARHVPSCDGFRATMSPEMFDEVQEDLDLHRPFAMAMFAQAADGRQVKVSDGWAEVADGRDLGAYDELVRFLRFDD